jgi:hypothetical protein
LCWERESPEVDGTQEFIIALISNGAWPLVVLILGFFFRKTLRSVFERLTAFEGLGAKMDFDAGIRRLDEKADVLVLESKTQEEDEPDDIDHAPDDDDVFDEEDEGPEDHEARSPASDVDSDFAPNARPFGRFIRQWHANETPGGTIMNAWSILERDVFMLYVEAVKSGLITHKHQEASSFRKVLSALVDSAIVRDNEMSFIEDLRDTRDTVAHASVRPSEGQMLAYLEACEAAKKILEKATKRANALSKSRTPFVRLDLPD